MRLSFRLKLFLVCVGLVMASVLAASAYLSAALDRQLTARIRNDLLVRLAILQERLSSAPAPASDDGAWDDLTDQLGARAHARVTVIDMAGRVLGDSAVTSAELASLENHAARPEIVEALREGHGSSSRMSGTAHQRMLYVAVPFTRGGQPGGVVRAALPLTEVDAAVGAARRLLVLAAALALAVALMASGVAARRMSAVVRRLTEAALRMAGGDLTARAQVGGDDELGGLGKTLDGLAAGLDRTLGELRSERDLLSGILEAMAEGLLLVDADGRIALVNRALREMLLLDADAIGRPPLEAIRHAELQALIACAGQAGGATAAEIDVQGVRPMRLLVRARKLAGEPRGALVVFVDVTELRRLESVRRDFVANASHELRTPVAAIRSASETLREGAATDPAAAPRFLAAIERNAERLQNLVEDLLDLSRIESRQYRLRPEPLDLAQAVSVIEEGLRERAAASGARLKHLVPATLPRVRADRRALEQVLTNLLDNAIRHGGGCEVVTSAALSGAAQVKLTVADTGPGIAPHHLPRLFERFYRIDAGRSRERGGTGLGLAIVKHLVEAMDGVVRAESEPGKGAAFSVTLPADVGSAPH